MTAALTPSDRRTAVMTPIALVGSAIVFLLAAAALLNGWLGSAPWPAELKVGAVIAHLTSVMLALPLGIAQLILPKGTASHRVLGYVWIVLMVFTALASFAVHAINPGGLSPIHLFSILTLVMAPLIVYFARTGRVLRHQRSVLGLMTGGLVIAGLFTFVPGRALGILVERLFGLH